MPDTQTAQNFAGHYEEWRARRIAMIIDWFGTGWFFGRRILELGAGYGDIGEAFRLLGADVYFTDGRPEHVEEMRRRKPSVKADRIFVHDAEQGVPQALSQELILHLGLLYHLDNWRLSLQQAAQIGSFMVLETEVSDSDDPSYEVKLTEGANLYDQSLSGTGTRPSAPMIEDALKAAGFHFKRIDSDRLNANRHVYDWPVTNSGKAQPGQRRWWFCGKGRWRPISWRWEP